MDSNQALAFVEQFWAERVVPTLTEYIRIPNRSPAFDAGWEKAGHMRRAFDLVEGWFKAQGIRGMAVEQIWLPGRTPVLLAEVPGTCPGTILFYGHLDKQPEMSGWRAGLAPWQPVLEGDRLYGRGGADDGYAGFATVAALALLQHQGVATPRLIVLLEGSEESGSPDLPAYMDALAPRLGDIDLVICLDSGCGNYDQLWCTTSLRGLVNLELDVAVLAEGVHSGGAGGIVPSSFAIIRELIGRLEDRESGEVLVRGLYVEIPHERLEQAREAARVLGKSIRESYPLLPGVQPLVKDPYEQILARTWRPALEIIGAGGLPGLADAGNVLRPHTALKLSVRLPPTCAAPAALAKLKSVLEREPPHGARVEVRGATANQGWNAPPTPRWLANALAEASQATFGKPAVSMGEGGTIPFMAMLGERFPQAAFVITGVLGPGSNAHGPNEFLHLPTARRLSAAMAMIVAARAAKERS